MEGAVTEPPVSPSPSLPLLSTFYFLPCIPCLLVRTMPLTCASEQRRANERRGEGAAAESTSGAR